MGQCIACNSVKVVPKVTPDNINIHLENTRNTLVNEIHNLHKIFLGCSSGVDDCLLKGNKAGAFVLKTKEVLIKSKTKDLQKLIQNIDEAISLDRNSKKKQAFIEGTKMMRELQDFIFANDISQIIDDNSNYCSGLEKQIKKLQIEFSKIQLEIDQKISDIQNNPEAHKRKRYSKRHIIDN